METFYSKTLFDILQLIQAKQFKRALVLSRFLIDKGFRTVELIVVMSYVVKMVEGPVKALEVIKEFTEAKEDEKEEGSQQALLKSPLITMAKTQYEIQNRNLKQALSHISQFQLQSQPNHQTQPQNLPTILQSLKQNFTSIFQPQSQTSTSQPPTNFQSSQNPSTNIVQTFRKQLNQLTQSYIQSQNLYQQPNQQTDPFQNAIRFGQFYLQYDQIKQRILAVLSKQIRVESQPVFNVKANKKQKQLKKHNTRELFFKDVKPSVSPDFNKKLNKSLNNCSQQQDIQPEDKIKQLDRSQHTIQELQTLLLQVNKFINFFKSRLKVYGASRVKQIDIKQA